MKPLVNEMRDHPEKLRSLGAFQNPVVKGALAAGAAVVEFWRF